MLSEITAWTDWLCDSILSNAPVIAVTSMSLLVLTIFTLCWYTWLFISKRYEPAFKVIAVWLYAFFIGTAGVLSILIASVKVKHGLPAAAAFVIVLPVCAFLWKSLERIKNDLFKSSIRTMKQILVSKGLVTLVSPKLAMASNIGQLTLRIASVLCSPKSYGTLEEATADAREEYREALQNAPKHGKWLRFMLLGIRVRYLYGFSKTLGLGQLVWRVLPLLLTASRHLRLEWVVSALEWLVNIWRLM